MIFLFIFLILIKIMSNSKIDNMRIMIGYLNKEVIDKENENFNNNIKYLMYLIGSIALLNIIIKGNK